MSDLKILAVDDDPISLQILENGLKVTGYEVITAASGVEATELINNYYYDVVLTDLQMPGGVDGIGVLEAAKAKNSNTEVILITAFASIDNAVKAMQKGAADYLQKPINFDELILRLQKISTMRALFKSALDLREAMDVTEKSAAQTIQDLEMTVNGLEKILSDIHQVVTKQEIAAEKRVEMVLEMLSSF